VRSEKNSTPSKTLNHSQHRIARRSAALRALFKNHLNNQYPIMPVPDYESMMLPTLKIASDGRTHTTEETLNLLAKQFGVTEDDRRERSGSTYYFDANFGWTKTYLKKADLISYPGRSQFMITDLGRKILAQNPTNIDKNFLSKIPSFRGWLDEWNWEKGTNPIFPDWSAVRENTTKPIVTTAPQIQQPKSQPSAHQQSETRTPEETVELNLRIINGLLIDDLLEKIKVGTPRFFEQLVIDLLIAMGYGGGFDGAGQVVGRSGDGGIDGVIHGDKLGLTDSIVVQAKKWDSQVPVSAVRDFSGSFDQRRVRKGVMITTADFSSDARKYVGDILPKKVILIDGKMLAQLMIEHGVGVTTVKTFAIKRVDSDYFPEE
jgi:restriction system protein